MAIRYAKQYTNQSEYIYDLAKSTGKFDEQTYASLVESNKADDYASAVANTKYMTSDTFDQKTYDLLAGEAKYNYLLNEYYVDKSSEDYLKNKQYLDLEIQKAVDAKTFDSLNGFEKTMATIGGVVGNAINELVGGTVEGLVDVLGTVVGAVGSVINADFGEDVKQWVAGDFTGVAAIRNDLARFNRAYTYIDKNGFVKGVNDVVTGLVKMAPLLIPSAGTAIYFGGMAGNVAEEAIIQNPNIDYSNLLLYTGAVTATELATEKLSSVLFGGSAIDNLMFKTSGSKAGSWWARIGLDFLSEGMEESVSEFADSVLYTALVDNNAPIASIQDILYAGLIGGIIGGISAGGRIMSTSRLGITKDGVLIDTKSLTTEQRKSFEGKILGRAQTLTLQERLQNVRNAMDSNAITDLQAKYKNLTLDEIKNQHADEYQKALDRNVKFQTELNEAAIALSKILDLIGETNFVKATELANYTAEQTRTAISNYLNRTTATSEANRIVERKYSIKNPGSSITINDNLTTEQQRLKDSIKELYGIDVFFGDLGFKDGIKKKNGLTLDEKTIVIDSTVSNRMSLNDVINTVVKEELVHTLQYDEYILDASTINDLNEQYTGKLGGKISGVKAKSEYKGEQLLTQISENQAKFLSESLLFDELTISRVFITNNSTFNKVYKWLNSRKEAIEQKKNKKTNKDKVEYRILLQTMETYRKSVANVIGNTEDADTVASELNLTDEQYQKLIDTFVPDFSNQHYTLLGKNYTIHTERRMNAEKFLSDNRKVINKMLPLMWRNVYNPEYYEDSFVEKIMSRNPEEDFRYNLQEYMITTYGFTINDVDNCLMEIVDFNKVITKDFDNDLEDLIADPNSLDKYETVDQIFRPTFKNKFKGELKDIDIKFIKISTDQSTKAQYIPMDPETGRATIKVYIKEGVTFTPSQIGVLRHNIFHELTHALGDIQGLQNGTSTNYVKSALLEIKDDKIINRLANLLLTKDYRDANKNNKRELIDAIAYGIYRITDGEYAAESYPDSATRKGELEVALKAGATMNRSGFRTDGRVLYGYGRFSGIVLEAKTITQSKLEFDVKGLRRAFDVVSYSLENTLLKSLEEQGITDFEEAGFSDEFIYDILENPEATIDDVWDKINKNAIGSEAVSNTIVKWIAPNNKNITTMNDVLKVTQGNGLAYGYIIRQQTLKSNPDYDINKTHTYNEFETKITDLMLKSDKNSTIIMNNIEKVANKLNRPVNDTVNQYIIENDFDYSFKDINDLYAKIASQYGLDSSREQELITRQTSEGKELNLAEQASQYGVEESPEDKLIREEEQAEDKRTIVDKTKESFENFKQSMREWLTTDQQNIMGKKANEASALLESLDKLSKSELKDDPEIKAMIDDIKSGKFLKDIIQEVMTDDNAFAIRNKLGRNSKTLKELFGENYLKISGLSEILPKTKSNYVKQIKTELSRLEGAKLTTQQNKLVKTDYSKLNTPNALENYLRKLQEISVEEIAPTDKITTDKTGFIKFDDYSEQDLREQGMKKQYVKMSPSEYIDKAFRLLYEKNAPKESYEAWLKKQKQPRYEMREFGDISNTEYFKNKIKKGEQFDMPYLDYVTLGQEGLHRAFVAEDLGIQEIDVAVMTKLDQPDVITEDRKTVSEEIKTQAVSETIDVKKPNTITKAILDKYKIATQGISEAQFFDETDKSYVEVGYAMIEENAAIFSSINNDNYEQVRNEIKADTSFYSDQALLIFDLYTLEMIGKFSPEIQNKIKAYNRRELTKSAQKLALQSKRVANKKPVNNIIRQLESAGYKVNIPESVIGDYDAKLKDKDARIKELSDRIAELEQEIKESKNQLEQQALLQEVKEASDEKLTLETGSTADILDMIVNREDLATGAKITEELLSKFLEISEKAEAADKNVGYYMYDKEGRPVPFPKLSENITKFLKKARAFRMWSMLSSPITWVRNWIGNQGMKLMDSFTNAFERFISSKTEFASTEMKYNESKAGKEVYNHILNSHEAYIYSLVKGDVGKYSDEKLSDSYRAQLAEIKKKQISDESNAFRKLILKASRLTEIGLEEGVLGDQPIMINSICKNMGNLVASNIDFLLNGVKNERDALSAKSKLTPKQEQRLAVLNKALKTKNASDVFDALSVEEMTRLFDNAKQRSAQQYFKNQNNLNKWFSKFGSKHPLGAELVSWIMPFPKVAANILSMAYRYSPVGLIRSFKLLSTYRQTQAPGYKGSTTGFEKAEVIRSFSENAVGGVMLVAGAIAALLGWIDIDDDDYMGPSLNFGSFKIGLSQLAPSMTTFSAAAAMTWAWKNNKSGVSEALNVLYDNTLLGNVENIFRYSSPEKYAENLSISYLSQYIPAVLKLVNKTVFKSSTKDKSGPYLLKVGKTLASYVPGLSELVPDKIDPYTGGKVYASGSSNWFLNFIAGVSPIDIKYTQTSELAYEAERLNAKTTGLDGSFVINGKNYTVSNNKKEQLAKYRASYISERFDAIVSGKEKVTVENDKGKRITTTYDELTDEQKNKVLKRIYSDGTEMVKIKYWISLGNRYVTTDRDLYREYRNEFGSSIMFRETWSKSKFVEG